MWRFFINITRGCRTVRPSQCCTQDAVDETSCSVLQNEPSALTSPYSVILRNYTCCGASKQDDVIPLSALAGSVHRKITQRSGSNVDAKHGHSELVWTWGIPCDVFPQASNQKNERLERIKYNYDQYRFHQQRYQQLMQAHYIVNAVAWGSAATLTWTFCHHTRKLFEKKDKKVENQNRYSSNTSSKRTCESGNGYPEQNINKLWPSPEWWLSFGFTARPSNVDQRNPNQKTESFQPNTKFLNPAVPESLFAFQLPATVKKSAIETTDRDEQEKDEYLQPLEANVLNSTNHFDTKPHTEVDKQELDTLSQQGKIEDSGYSDRDLETGYCSSPQDISLELFDEPEDGLDETLLNCSKTVESCDKLEGCSGSELDVEQHSLVTDTSQLGFESTSAKIEISEKKWPRREEVLIEDCSVNDDCQHYISTPAQSTVPKPKASPSGQKVINEDIDEFSDGLKTILEVGRKDLNDFNTQFLGVLEGGISRSVSNEEPDHAVTYFQAGSLLGDPASSFNLALCYHLARGVKQDLKKARELYEAASLQGHGWATYNYAVLLSEGQGGPADPVKARALLRKAGEMGVHEAQLALKQMEEMQDNAHGHKKKKNVAHTVPSESRHLTRSTQSELSLSSVFSHVWSSSYSTTDLDFLEDSFDQQEMSSSLKLEASGKPTFFLNNH